MLPSADLTVNLMFVLSAIICYFIYVYKKRYMFWETLGVPSLGFSRDIILETKRHKALSIQDQYNAMASHPYFGIYQATKPILVIRDPELIRNILIKDFSHFNDHGWESNEKLDPLTASLFRLSGQRWKNIRTKLAPSFSAGKLKAMFPLIEDCNIALERYLTDEMKRSKGLDVLELMLKFTLDVIGTCGFGLKCDAIADDKSEFHHICQRLIPSYFKTHFRMLLRAIHPKIITWLGCKEFDQDVEDFFMSLTRETIRHRDENQDKRNDFMQLLINLQHEEQKASTEPIFTDHAVAAQVLAFLFAGHETTGVTLANCLYELALNPDIMDKVHAEILQVLDTRGEKLDYDALKEMRYLDCVVSETLRKHPTDAWLIRICTKAYEFTNSSLLIKENTSIIIPVHSLHSDPEFFPEPDKFNPDRFSEENKSNVIPGTYLPFGDGPRVCIGARFAMMVMRAALSSIIRTYTVHPTNQTQIPLGMAEDALLFVRPQGIHLRFQKRVN